LGFLICPFTKSRDSRRGASGRYDLSVPVIEVLAVDVKGGAGGKSKVGRGDGWRKFWEWITWYGFSVRGRVRCRGGGGGWNL